MSATHRLVKPVKAWQVEDDHQKYPAWIVNAIVAGEMKAKSNGCIYIGKGEAKQIASVGDWITWDDESYAVLTDVQAAIQLRPL